MLQVLRLLGNEANNDIANFISLWVSCLHIQSGLHDVMSSLSSSLTSIGVINNNLHIIIVFYVVFNLFMLVFAG